MASWLPLATVCPSGAKADEWTALRWLHGLKRSVGGAVGRGGGEIAALGGEGQGLPRLARRQTGLLLRLAFPQGPQLDELVGPAAGQPLAVRAEGDGVDRLVVDVEGADPLGLLARH